VGDWRGEGYISYIGYFAVYLGVYSLSDKKIFFRLWRLFSFVSYIVSIIGIISYSGVFYIDSTTAAMSSVFVNGNHFGYYLAVAFIASAYHYLSSEKTEKALHFAGLCLVSFSYIVSRCRGAWIGGALALIFFIIILLVQKKYKPISVFVPVFVLLFSFAAAQIIYNTSFNRLISIFRDANSLISSSEDQLEIGTKRWLLWTGGMKLVFIRPFFGFGLDNVGDRLKSLSITHTNRVHNEYLQYILSIGLVGAFAYFVFLLKIIIACLKNVFKISFISLAVFCAALAYLVSAFFGNTTPYVTPLFFMLMGWLSRHMRDFKQVN
jgi:O-antigen ligase